MNEKLNIQDLIDLLAEKHGMSKKNADSFVKEFFQLIEEALEKDKYVKIKGLGAFKLIDVESRESVNVNTGERFEIQGHTKVSFTPEPALKDIINKPFSHFETVVLNDGTVLEDTPIDSGNEDEEEAEQKTEGGVSGEAEGSQGVKDAVNVPPVEVVREAIADIPEEIETPKETESLVETSSSEETKSCSEEITVSPEEKAVETLSATSEEEVGVEETKAAKTDGPTESSTMKYFIGIVVLVVLLCAGTVVYLYYPDLFDKLSTKPPVEEIVDAEVDKQTDDAALTDSIADKDTVIVAKADTVSMKPAVEPVTKKPDVEIPRFLYVIGADIAGRNIAFVHDETGRFVVFAWRLFVEDTATVQHDFQVELAVVAEILVTVQVFIGGQLAFAYQLEDDREQVHLPVHRLGGIV